MLKPGSFAMNQPTGINFHFEGVSGQPRTSQDKPN